jgi:hypothetical protein
MRNHKVFFPLALLTLAALPAAAQEMPRVIFCAGQCFAVGEDGKRVPVAKGAQLVPGQRLETGPDSYLQVKLGPDAACAIGERARVRFDPRVRDRDVVILDQGRIRLIGGEAIGRPGLRPVELYTADGKFDLKSADIEVKSLPKTADAPLAPTLVKLNTGEARLGDLPVTKEAVQGISGGKILERTIPIADIALPRRDAPATKAGDATAPSVRQPFAPVAVLPAPEPTLTLEPVKVSPAIMSSELANSSLMKVSPTLTSTEKMTLLNSDPAQAVKPYTPPVDSAMIVRAFAGVETSAGLQSFDGIAKQAQIEQKAAPTAAPKPPLTEPVVFKLPADNKLTVPVLKSQPKILLK